VSEERRFGLAVKGVRLNRRELAIPPDLGEAEFQLIGEYLCTIQHATQWGWGDWVAYGELKYGDITKMAAALAPLGAPSVVTMRNYGVVSRRFEPSRRSDVPFSFHQDLTSMPPEEADELLGMAVEHKWTRQQLRVEKAAREYTLRRQDSETRERLEEEERQAEEERRQRRANESQEERVKTIATFLATHLDRERLNALWKMLVDYGAELDWRRLRDILSHLLGQEDDEWSPEPPPEQPRPPFVLPSRRAQRQRDSDPDQTPGPS
jgi:hypothetical protein